MDEDKKKFEVSNKNKSISFGIPSQVINDPKKSNVFLCLFNPRTRTMTNGINNLHNYISQENDDENGLINKHLEQYDDIELYYKHIINYDENILTQEFSHLQKSYIGKNKIEYEVIKDRINKIIKALQKAFDIKDDDDWKVPVSPVEKEQLWKSAGTTKKGENHYLSKIGITLDISLIKKSKKLLKNLLENYVDGGKKIKELSDEEFKKQVNDDEWQELISEINKREKSWKVYNASGDKLLDIKQIKVNKIFPDTDLEKISQSIDNRVKIEIFNQIKNSIDPLKEEYYLFSYYYFLLKKKGESRKEYFNSIVNDLSNDEKDEFMNEVKEYKICDLELMPYRSDHISDIKYRKNYMVKNNPKYNITDLSSSMYVASIIVDRIKKYNEYRKDGAVKPYFIFRSNKAWMAVISKYIRDYLPEESNWEGNVPSANYKEFFFTLSSSNGSLSPKNIYKFTEGDETESLEEEMIENSKNSIYGEMKKAIKKD